MGNKQSQLKTEEISLIILSILIVCFIIGAGVVFGTAPKVTSAPTVAPTRAPTFTRSPTRAPTFTPGPTSAPTNSPTAEPTSAPSPPHLAFIKDAKLDGPPNAPPNFYRKGCTAALSEGLFPFDSFNTTGKFYSGILQDYFKYDTWGWSGKTPEFECGWTLSGGKNPCVDPKPNIPWSDEQCDICATASKDSACRWTDRSSDCGIWNGVQYVQSYRDMDISECWYNALGLFNAHKLCCDPSVSTLLPSQ
jgi:hypothetical protein